MNETSLLKEFGLPNNKTGKRVLAELAKKLHDLSSQADIFDMEVDVEALRLVPVRQKQESHNTPWLDRWIFHREDKQWDHENQNNDGGE